MQCIEFAARWQITAVQNNTRETKLMYKKITAVFAFATIISAGAFAATSTAATKQQPKITMEQARATALKKAPGKVTSEELENEKGKLIYSFDIATSKTGV